VEGEDVEIGRLFAELAEHGEHLAAVKRGVIDGMEEKFPDGDAAVDAAKFGGEIGFGQGFKIVLQAVVNGRPIFLKRGQIGFGRRIAKETLVANFDQRRHGVGVEALQPDTFGVIDVAERAEDGGVGRAEFAIQFVGGERGAGVQQELIGPRGIGELMSERLFVERHNGEYSEDRGDLTGCGRNSIPCYLDENGKPACGKDPKKKQVPRANTALGMTIFVIFAEVAHASLILR